MTLKELRKKKGFTQAECASILGMTVRNYQNYENNPKLTSSAKYNAIYRKLDDCYDSLYKNYNRVEHMIAETPYKTNVRTGPMLKAMCETISNYEKRDCFSFLKKYIDGDYHGKVGILYGLRRTGKTTLLLQMINELPLEKTAYIKMKESDNMAILTRDLDILFHFGYQYIFIDEITLLEDFINTAAVLSDLYTTMDVKIVLSGTDSLGFELATYNELYDRTFMIHTSFIPYREYERLLNFHSIDSYIEYGGTLKKENMDYSDSEYSHEDVAFKDDESTRKYIDSAIAGNIEHSLKNDHYGKNFRHLIDLYDQGELQNAINRIVQEMNHQFLVSVVEDKFKSTDFGSSRDLLLHEQNSKSAKVLYDVDKEKIIERLKKIIRVKEKEECQVKITSDHIEEIKRYLKKLDLIVNSPIVHKIGSDQEHYIFTQPGLRYSITKALCYSLKQDDYFNMLNEETKENVINKILEDVKGRMLREIVLLETIKAIPNTKKAFKFQFEDSGEFDMVIYDSITNSCSLFEVKHSEKKVLNQAKYLMDKEKCDYIENRFGKINKKVVLYRGKTLDIDSNDIQWMNVEEYLCNLK